MTLSAQDRRKIDQLLDQMDAAEAKRVIASQDSFERWLRTRLPEIYRKIKEQLAKIWDWFRSVFS